MKNLVVIVALLLIASCKQESPESQMPLKYADVDTSSNAVVQLTDADDVYFTLDDLIEENKGKIIYVNFFNSQVPVENMRATEALEKKMDSSSFILLNISTEAIMDPFQAHLRITTLKHNYLARNFPDADFYETHKFLYIPRALIYDATGKLIDDNALGSIDERLESVLQELIDQK